MKPYTHILFDLDGTITDPAEGITTCVRHALHCQGIEEENYQNLCRMIGPPLAEGFRDFYDMDEEHAWQAVRDFRELFAKIGVEKNIPYPGMKEALLRLRDAGKVLCAAAMAAGTALGGRRIIDTVGREMVSLGPREGFSADLAGILCLLVATLLGLPVSTTHTRTAALLGVGAAGPRGVDRRVVRSVLLAWLATFPGCMALGYGLARAALARWS